MTETLELSKRLEKCAKWHDEMAFHYAHGLMPEYAKDHIQWAADIRSITIPEPQQ